MLRSSVILAAYDDLSHTTCNNDIVRGQGDVFESHTTCSDIVTGQSDLFLSHTACNDMERVRLKQVYLHLVVILRC